MRKPFSEYVREQPPVVNLTNFAGELVITARALLYEDELTQTRCRSIHDLCAAAEAIAEIAYKKRGEAE
jgi:hypothetical protein